ncbi:hypothetical protein LOC68_26860 [Blastopirellula sp. JC732]|uniref:Uncharacterized protein n=1 Tax=Blastopirellula sediminis TaxID=2894196 RepID=A0A9X1MTC0_9BACT|nr:hypothetical protein [Blastopirellula sediminis]MCC9604672.1 hypothetical protein [Blastopirellula sediminis]MCC9632030.1 hypothetical protein [Blastopirellula sediminis]
MNAPDRDWYIVRRWQSYVAEMRVVALRMAAIVVCYGLQLWHHFGLLDEAGQAANAEFHKQATLIACGWLFLSLAVWLVLLRRWFPPLLSYVSTAVDIAFLTTLIAASGGPTATQLDTFYFFIIILAGLRFELPLVWCATLATMVGFMASVGAVDKTWFDAEHTVPPISQGITLVSLGAAGIVVGQIVRRSKDLAVAYAERKRQGGEA